MVEPTHLKNLSQIWIFSPIFGVKYNNSLKPPPPPPIFSSLFRAAKKSSPQVDPHFWQQTSRLFTSKNRSLEERTYNLPGCSDHSSRKLHQAEQFVFTCDLRGQLVNLGSRFFGKKTADRRKGCNCWNSPINHIYVSNRAGECSDLTYFVLTWYVVAANS